MKLEINGDQYSNFISARCELRLDALSDSFRFEAVAPRNEPLPFKGGDPCRVIVDGEAVLTGNIELIEVSYNGTDHTITISGRDKTADLVDSTLDEIDDIRGEGLTLKMLIEIVLKNIGLDIKVIDEADTPPFTITEDIAAPEVGENAFSFIEKYARKRQVLLTSNSDGNITIVKNSGVTADGVVQHIIGANDNNVLDCNFSYDTSGRYNAYKLASGLNPVALNSAGVSDLASLVNQSGGVFDSEIRSSRQLMIVSSDPFSSSNLLDRAKWEADIRRARGLLYSATVPLFRVGGKTGDLWRLNRIYQITDDFVGKIEPMLCNSITYSLDSDSGRNTVLGFVGQKAYTLFLEPDPFAEIANNVA